MPRRQCSTTHGLFSALLHFTSSCMSLEWDSRDVSFSAECSIVTHLEQLDQLWVSHQCSDQSWLKPATLIYDHKQTWLKGTAGPFSRTTVGWFYLSLCGIRTLDSLLVSPFLFSPSVVLIYHWDFMENRYCCHFTCNKTQGLDLMKGPVGRRCEVMGTCMCMQCTGHRKQFAQCTPKSKCSHTSSSVFIITISATDSLHVLIFFLRITFIGWNLDKTWIPWPYPKTWMR